MCSCDRLRVHVPGPVRPARGSGVLSPPLATDLAALSAAGTDAVYVPSPADIYPPHFSAATDAPVGRARRNRLAEGAVRPTFFRGVATVLLPLLAAARPDALFAGQKDAQQVAVMRALWRRREFSYTGQRCSEVPSHSESET